MEKDIVLIRAKVKIVMDQPFYATLMMKRSFIPDYTIPTACTNGDYIKYNPDFFKSLKQEEVVGVIVHELMHITNLHHFRREGRNLEQWNEACDYAINPMILRAGFSLPKGILNDRKYDNMSAEQIYALLPPGKEGGGGGSGSGSGHGIGGVEDADVSTKSEKDQAMAETKQEVAQAMQIAKQQGKLPAELDRLIEEIMEPQVAWQEKLARFLTEVAKNDYSFTRPNQRYLQCGFILPSLYSLEMGETVLMVDTSGSVDKDQLNRVAGEMQDVCAMFKSTIKVLYIDAKVAGEQDIEPDDSFDLEPKGGGGTDFRPGFTWLKENGIEPKAVIYFTDGDCSKFPAEPDMPVLWAIHGGNKKFKPPFGEVMNID